MNHQLIWGALKYTFQYSNRKKEDVRNENEETEFMKIFKEYKVEKVVYGHLHGPSNVKAIEGDINGVEYIMTSCDFIDFNPIKILD